MRFHKTPLTLVTLLVGFIPWTGEASSSESSFDLPIERIQLFNSGVGYFEHLGEVEGKATVALRFKTEQINDILKSLLLEDRSGGKIGSVVYPSQDPLSKILQSFQVNPTQSHDLFGILGQVQGAKVRLQASGETFEGVVLGVEQSTQTTPEGHTVRQVSSLNLLSGANLRSFKFDNLTSLEFLDPKLQEDLTQALSLIANQRGADTKPIELHFEGEGTRQVRVGYLVETPVWKTSYRLVLPATPEGRGYLQGWAIVENQTENDWEEVDLSLISGQPISFQQDLYQPLYAQRPVVQPELGPRIAPPSYEGGLAGFGSGGEGAGGGMAYAGVGVARRQAGREKGVAQSVAPPPPADVMEADNFQVNDLPAIALGDEVANRAYFFDSSGGGVSPTGEAAEVGELFEYHVPKVSLPRQKSALIPIVGDAIAVDRLSIYNQSVHPKHPLNGIRLTNDTGKHLQRGPVTVLDGDAYAGDARLTDLPDGQERLMSYALDQKVQVETEDANNESMTLSGSIVKGVLQVSNRRLSFKTYRLANRAEEERTVILEHAFRPGWELRETPEPEEKTSDLYRFEMAVPAGATETLTVQESQLQEERMAILSLDDNRLDYYTRNNKIPEPVRRALTQAGVLKQQIVDTEREIASNQTKIGEITAEQERIRANMGSISDRQTSYYTRLLSKLDEQETELEKLRLEIENLRDQLDRETKAYADYVEGLEL